MDAARSSYTGRRPGQARPIRQDGGTFGRGYDPAARPARHPARQAVAAGRSGRRRRRASAATEGKRVSELLAKIVPLAIAAAINPTGILVLVALLATSKRTGLAYCIGFCATFAGFGAVVLALGLRLQLKPSATTSIVDLVAALLIAYLGVRALRKEPKPEGEKRRALGAAGVG